MKRVKYAAGAVMLTPVALAVPAVAQAATTTAASSTTQGKTVSMHGVGIRVHPDTCTGTNHVGIGAHPNSHAKGQFWETRFNPGSVCIGTIDVSLFFTKTFSKSASVTVNSVQGTQFVGIEEVHGTAGHWAAGGAFPVKTIYRGAGVVDMSVCIASQFDGGKKNCVGA
jgi:hypothetical protein